MTLAFSPAGLEADIGRAVIRQLPALRHMPIAFCAVENIIKDAAKYRGESAEWHDDGWRMTKRQ